MPEIFDYSKTTHSFPILRKSHRLSSRHNILVSLNVYRTYLKKALFTNYVQRRDIKIGLLVRWDTQLQQHTKAVSLLGFGRLKLSYK
ncbi:hypothetical protein NSTC745_04515 [Nostoc sp. DSM 114161]|jgi:hypothetical protein